MHYTMLTQRNLFIIKYFYLQTIDNQIANNPLHSEQSY
jgi:hypothetical protein